MFEKEKWIGALSLSERASISTNNAKFARNQDSVLLHQEWITQAPFDNPAYFNQMIESRELTPEQFESIVCEEAELDIEAADFEWLTKFQNDYKTYFNNDSIYNDLDWGSVIMVKPAILSTIIELENKLNDTHANSPAFNTSTAMKALIPLLLGRIKKLTSKTFVLEMQVAKLKGLLKGETPEERFLCYSRLYEDPEYFLATLNEYPLLLRLSISVAGQWNNMCFEMLERLSKDHAELNEVFFKDQNLSQFKKLLSLQGDTHNHGRCVLVIEFNKGEKIVYKPRDLSVDIHFNQLLEWLSETSELTFARINILNKYAYGWCEFIEQKECKNENEIVRFYNRIGGLTALLYSLNAIDFHYENIIALGEQPVLIDLETIIHPELQSKSNINIEYDVTHIGLLPRLEFSIGNKKGYDLSGLSGIAGQKSTVEMLQLRNRNTDKMHYRVGTSITTESNNLPKLNKRSVNAGNYSKHLINGFEHIYNTLQSNHSELLKTNGIIELILGCNMRYINRMTMTYSNILTESYHPDRLRNALERDCWLDKLWLGVNSRPSSLIALEQYDLASCNIPLFTYKPNDTKLIHSTAIVEGTISSTSNNLNRKIKNLSASDLERQIGKTIQAFERFMNDEEIQKLYQ